jgi:hypothetical protein
MPLQLSYQTSRDRRLENERQQASPTKESVIWNLSALGLCSAIVALSYVGGLTSLLMIPAAFLIGILQVVIVGPITVAGIWRDDVPASKIAGMLTSWLVGAGLCWFGLRSAIEHFSSSCC